MKSYSGSRGVNFPDAALRCDIVIAETGIRQLIFFLNVKPDSSPWEESQSKLRRSI